MTGIDAQNPENRAPEGSAPPEDPGAAVDHSAGDASAEAGSLPSPLPADIAGVPAHLEQLAGRARDYADAASSKNTRRAYGSDWTHFCGWCRRQGLGIAPPSPQVVGLYITACASGAAIAGGKPNSVATIERRLSAAPRWGGF